MPRRRDARTYITVHDGMPDHPKIEGLSDAAFRLLVTSWCWCSRNLTDGEIKAASWVKRGTERARQELVAAGLAVPDSQGNVFMHDYLEHQRSAEEVKELSAKRSEAGRRGGNTRAKQQATAKQTPKQVLKPEPSKTQAESVTEVLLTEALPTTPAVSPPQRPAEQTTTVNQRAQDLARRYVQLVPLSKFPAVMGIAKQAINAGYSDPQIQAALQRLAAEGRPLTVDVLRVELEGLPARNGQRHQPFRNPTNTAEAYGGKL